MKYVIALYGKSGAGKDSVKDCLLEDYGRLAEEIKRYTTRPKRSEDDDSYHFVDESEFLTGSYEFSEHFIFRGWHYGTKRDSILSARSNLLLFTGDAKSVDALRKDIFEYSEEVTVIPIEIFSSKKERIMRAIGRVDFEMSAEEIASSISEIGRRFLTEDKEELPEIPGSYRVENKDRKISDALDAIREIMIKEMISC